MITLRKATQDDVATLQNLNDEVFIDNIKYDTDLDMGWAKGPAGFEYFTQLLGNSCAFCVIAEDEGTPIGYIAASPYSISYRKGAYVELENMGVVPDYRSKGIGTILMNEFSTWSKAQGFTKVRVNAYSANTGALEFYKKNGFDEMDITLEKEIT